MSRLLVVQPDSLQADVLREALQGRAPEDVVVAESLDDALFSIDKCVPDVILVPTLIAAALEDYLIAYLNAIPNADHVRILGLPRFERSGDPVEHHARSRFPWWRWRWGRKPVVVVPSCDPGVFAEHVIFYLASSSELRMECAASAALHRMSDRRTRPRFACNEVPWISGVSFGGERVALINVSSGGALLRSSSRPKHHSLRRSDPDALEAAFLTLELRTDAKVHAMGRVVRCVPLTTSALMHYEIAFSFDGSVGLELPAADTAVAAISRRGTTNGGSGFERSGIPLAENFRKLLEAAERS